MALEDAFQSGTDAVLNDLAQRPRPPKRQVPAFSIWRTLGAAPMGTAAGAAQVIGSSSEVLGAFGDVLATTEASAGGMFALQTEEERRASQAATEKLRTQGVDFTTEAGRSFRNVAQDYMPDPATSHLAEQAVANLFRVGVKAVGAGTLLGPLGGAAVAGAEEGFTTAEDLRAQGVDVATRTQVGAVTGVLNAFGFALPVAGQTIGRTVGLALAGGPVSFVAQQAATREILEGAGYDQLASQYDPFDPVGLTLSTVLPLGFGALAMRGAAKTAKPRMVPDEAVDAARVNLLTENLDTARVTPAADLPSATAQRAAITRAIDQMSSGERVDVLENISAPIAVEAAGRMAERLAKVMRQEDVWFSSSAVSDLSTLDPKFSKEGNLYGPGVYLARSREFSETYARGALTPTGERLPAGQTYQAEFTPVNPFDADKIHTRAEAESILKAAGIDAKQVRELLGQKPKVAGSTIYQALDKRMGKAAANETLKAQGFDAILFKSKGEQLAVSFEAVDVTPAPPRQAAEKVALPKAAEPTPEFALVPKEAAAEAAQAGGAPDLGGLKPEDQLLHARALEAEATNPDALVMVDGMTEPMPLGEFMEMVRAEVRRDLAEVPLIEVAANCALSAGGL